MFLEKSSIDLLIRFHYESSRQEFSPFLIILKNANEYPVIERVVIKKFKKILQIYRCMNNTQKQ